MSAHDDVLGGGSGSAVLAELLDRFHSRVGGTPDETQPRSAGPDPMSQWTVAEHDDGPPLCAVVELLGPLPPDAVAALALGICAELARLHWAGTVHRRLMPSNVLLSETGPRLVHSGIARTVDGATLTDLDGTPLTVAYMAPEQILGLPVGPHTDIFALGGVLAFAARGVPPFGGDEPLSVLYRIVNEEAVLDSVPDAVRGLVKACLSKDPAQRPTLQTLSDRAGGVLRDASSTRERTTDAPVAQEQTGTRPPPTRLSSIPIRGGRRRSRSQSRNVAILGTVAVGVAAAFLVRAVAESSTPSPAQTVPPPVPSTALTGPSAVLTATTVSTTTTTGGAASAPLPGSFLAGPGCPASPWASSADSVAPSGGLLRNLGGGPADCAGQAIAFLKTGVTTPGASGFTWTFRLGRSARCTLSVFIAATDASSGYAHYRLAVPAASAATAIFQINQSAANGRWVAAPELAGLSLPDGSVQLVLIDAAAYPGDRFHVTASAVRAACSPVT